MADLEIFFWKDNGITRVSYGGQYITPYNLSDGLNENKDNSVKDNCTNGKLNNSRYKLHNEIIKKYFANHKQYREGEEKLALFTGGGSASGKGTFTDPKRGGVDEYYSKNDNPVVIDADAIKKDLAKADTGSDVLTDELTGYYHEESSLLAKRIFEIGIKNRYPVLFDGTHTKPSSADMKLKLAEKYGYKTEMCYMVATPNTVLNSSAGRYEKSGRLVQLNVIQSAHKGAQVTVPTIASKFNKFKLYYRDGDNISMIAATTKGKPLEVKDTRKYSAFSNIHTYDFDSSAINAYNSRIAKIKEQREKNKK